MLKRKAFLSRSSPVSRSGITRKRRTPSEFARIYHSRARVRWVKAQRCVWCASLSPFFGAASEGRSHNAHTVNGGMGRKAGYETIVPLCASHHRRYDEHDVPFDDPCARQFIKDRAAWTEAAWRTYSGEAA